MEWLQKFFLIPWMVLKRHGFLIVPPVFYLATCAPTIGLGDTSIMLDAMIQGHLSSHVNNHPLTVLIGYFFTIGLPFDDIAFRGNLVSVLFGTLTIWIFYAAVYVWHENRVTATLCALLAMLCQSMWWHSTLVENYAATGLFTAIFLYLQSKLQKMYRPRYLYGLFAVMGLAVLNHVQMSFMCVAVAVTLVLIAKNMIKEKRYAVAGKLFAGCTISGLIGFVPWVGLVVRDSIHLGSLKWGLHQAFFGSFQHIMLHGNVWDGLWDFAVLLFLQFPHMGLLSVICGPYFFYRAWRFSPSFVGVVLFFSINSWFFMFYNTWDKYAFLLPSWLILAFVASFAVHAVVNSRFMQTKRYGHAALLLLALMNAVWACFYFASIATWANEKDSLWYQRFNNHYTHNTYRVNEYIVNPNKRAYWDIDTYIRALFAKLPEHSIYVDDDGRAYYPVEFYYRHYGMRPDLTLLIMNSWDIPNWGITKEQLHAKLDALFHNPEPRLFFVSIDFPFRNVIDTYARKDELRVERFYLDDKIWIYEIKASVDSDDVFPVLSIDSDHDFKSQHVRDRENVVHITDQAMQLFGNEWHHDDQLFVKFDAPGGFIDVPVTLEADFRGRLELAFTVAPDYGMVSVQIDDQPLLAEQSLFESKVAKRNFISDELSLAAGEHTLRFVIKPGSGVLAHWAFGVDTIRLISRS